MTARRLTRRHILEALSGTVLGASLPAIGCSTDSRRRPSSSFAPDADIEDAASVDSGPFGLAGFPSADDIWKNLERMNDLGPRYTGNAAHVKFVDMLASELEGLGLTVHRDSKTFFRWEVTNYGITVADSGEKIAATSYYPYSGETAAEGITAPLYYAGAAASPDFSGVKGKIAIIDSPVAPLPTGTLFHVVASYPASASGTFPDSVTNATSQLLSAPSLADALAAGAAGAILVWTNVSDDAARDQYLPFGRPHQGLPALWVGSAAGDRLKALAGAGASVKLTLAATTDEAARTDTIWTELPGKFPDEVIVINSHTDGPNAAEENGGVAILAIATALAALPRSLRRRSVVFALTTGHFAAGPGSIGAWIADHPDVMSRAVAAVTIEHCGCLEWNDDANGNYVATGLPDYGITMTPMKPEVSIFQQAMAGTANERMFAMDATSLYFGEGSPLFHAGVPALSYIPLPTYLCSGPAGGHIDKLSKSRMAAEILAFARAVRIMDSMAAADLRE